jgi:hypothetical protein
VSCENAFVCGTAANNTAVTGTISPADFSCVSFRTYLVPFTYVNVYPKFNVTCFSPPISFLRNDM